MINTRFLKTRAHATLRKPKRHNLTRSPEEELDTQPSRERLRERGSRGETHPDFRRIRRMLEGFLGKPWADVNAIIHDRVPACNLKHVLNMVEQHTDIIDGILGFYRNQPYYDEHGPIPQKPNFIPLIGNPQANNTLFIHPKTGLLAKNLAKRAPEPPEPPEPQVVIHNTKNPDTAFCKIRGLWFQFDLLTDAAASALWLLPRNCLHDRRRTESTIPVFTKYHYIPKIYSYGKINHTLNKSELKKLGLTNNIPPPAKITKMPAGRQLPANH
jgi:hypothetical protein